MQDWRFWMTLDFAQTTYSLLLLPYVLLSAPARHHIGLQPPSHRVAASIT